MRLVKGLIIFGFSKDGELIEEKVIDQSTIGLISKAATGTRES